MYDNTTAHNYFLAEQEERQRHEEAKTLSDEKPMVEQEIMYEGNLGFSLGVFSGMIDEENHIGEVRIHDGQKDRFDRWVPVA
jgi:hypothetical protein